MTKFITLLLVALTFTSIVVAEEEAAAQTSCKALILEAGADLGAYEAGVIKGLVDSYNALKKIEEVHWDVFVGVSVGSINAAGLGQYTKAQTVEMANWLVKLWQNIRKQDVYTNWLGGLVQGFLFEESLFKTDPLKAFLTKHITKKQQRKLSVGATNANTGEFERFDEKLSIPNLIQALMASSAVPALFPYQIFQGNTYLDGGVVRTIDVFGAIDKCLEIVKDPKQITLDIILISNKVLDQDVPSNLHPVKVGTLANNIKSYYKSRRALFEGHDYYPEVNWRYLIQPKTKLPDADFPLNFNAAQLKSMIDQGIAEANEAVKEHLAAVEVEQKTGDPELDNLSISAKRVFLEAYESLFDQQHLDANKTQSA